MNIVYASDDNYAEIAGISIASLFENNKKADDIHVFMLDNGITAENKERLTSIANAYSRSCSFVEMPDMEKIVGTKLDFGYWSLAVYSFLFMSSVLPKNLDRVIYLECDTMVRGSLLDLWNENLNGNLAGGCLSTMSKLRKKLVFLNAEGTHINPGMLLIDLKAWRDLDVESRFVNFIRFLQGKIDFTCEGVLNGVLSKYIKPLHLKYNLYIYYKRNCYNTERCYNTKHYIRQTGIENFYSDAILDEARRNPVIYHFLHDDDRPWIKGNIHFYQDEYMKYRSMTPWNGFPLREAANHKKKDSPFRQTMKKILRCLPTPLYKKYSFLRDLPKSYKLLREIAGAKRRAEKSGIKLEDCYINNIK